MNSVRSRVDSMGTVGNRNVAGVRRPMPAVQERDAANGLEITLADRFLNALQIEYDDPVLLLRHHLRERDTFLRIVARRPSILALVISIDIVEVAVDADLPGDLHGLAVYRCEQRRILFRIVEHFAVVRDWHAVLAVAE